MVCWTFWATYIMLCAVLAYYAPAGSVENGGRLGGLIQRSLFCWGKLSHRHPRQEGKHFPFWTHDACDRSCSVLCLIESRSSTLSSDEQRARWTGVESTVVLTARSGHSDGDEGWLTHRSLPRFRVEVSRGCNIRLQWDRASSDTIIIL